MRLYGVGTDIIRVKRLNKSLKKKLFLSRIFSEKEITKCKRTKRNSNCFSKRFAAKEAFSKALGTGISKGINFNEIIVLNEKSGKPYIKLINKTKKITLSTKGRQLIQSMGLTPKPMKRIKVTGNDASELIDKIFGELQ